MDKEVVYVSKLSIKGIGCKPKMAEEGKPARLCAIYGKADGIKLGEDKSGNVWQCLTGSFAAVNFETGEEFRSGKLFLPSGIHETVENAVKAIPEGSGLSVKFALELRSVVASNPIGYSYQAKNLIPTESSDELSELQKAIAAIPKLPALEAPKVEKAKK